MGKIVRLNACKRSGYVRIFAHKPCFIPNPENRLYVNGIKHDNRERNAKRKIFPNFSDNSRQIAQKALDGEHPGKLYA
jgi:hypothetical protein